MLVTPSSPHCCPPSSPCRSLTVDMPEPQRLELQVLMTSNLQSSAAMHAVPSTCLLSPSRSRRLLVPAEIVILRKWRVILAILLQRPILKLRSNIEHYDWWILTPGRVLTLRFLSRFRGASAKTKIAWPVDPSGRKDRLTEALTPLTSPIPFDTPAVFTRTYETSLARKQDHAIVR